MRYKPAEYNDLSPYLIVEGARGLIDFLKAALNARETRVFEHEGRVMHGEVMLGDSVLMLSDGSEQYPAIKSVLHLYVPDVDAAYQQAIAAGGQEVQPPQKGDDPDKRATFADPFGNLWSLGTQVDGD